MFEWILLGIGLYALSTVATKSSSPQSQFFRNGYSEAARDDFKKDMRRVNDYTEDELRAMGFSLGDPVYYGTPYSYEQEEDPKIISPQDIKTRCPELGLPPSQYA
jgi:hypothetical protein